MPMIL